MSIYNPLTVRRYLTAVADGAKAKTAESLDEQPPWRVENITLNNGDGTVKVTNGGAGSVPAGVQHTPGWEPQVGDRVIVLRIAGTRFVLGAVAGPNGLPRNDA